jgi:hypothetical protein
MFPFSGTGVMKLAQYQRLMRMGAGALMLLLVQGLDLSSSASAGCSHLIGAQSDPFVEVYLLDEVLFAGSSSFVPVDARFPGELPAPRRPKPCSSLSCPKSNRSPVSTASPEPVGADQWGTLGMRDPIDIMWARATTIEESGPGSQCQPCSIFHPPPFSG